jgi:hypothetical protein
MKNQILILALFFALSPLFLCATHFMGADLRYQNNPTGSNPNIYRIYSYNYYDCTGAATTLLPGLPQVPALNFSSPNCSQQPIALGPAVFVSYTELTPICPTATTQCTDNSAIIAGYLEGIYYRDYDFSGFASGCQINISFTGCCRNIIISSLTAPGADNIVSTTSLIIDSIQPNTSPRFVTPPVLYMCLGANAQYIHGTVEPDGDSLHYQLIPCMTSSTVQVSYAPGYSGTMPLGAANLVTINPFTGSLSIQSNAIEIGVVCIEVSEYRNGQLLSRSVRDIQVQIMNCNNTNTPPVIGDMNHIPGKISDTIHCTQPGPFQYQFSLSDIDPGQNLTATWTQNIPGANMTFTGTGNALTAFLDFQFLSSGVYHFSIEVRDDACPLRSYTAKDFTLYVYAHTEITGTVYDAGNNPIPGCRMYAVYHDTMLQTITAMDSFFADTSGNYSYGSCESNVYLKATPDSSMYPNLMPTYHTTSLMFSTANGIICPGGILTGQDIHLIAGSNPGGLGFIGGFISQGANKTAANPVVNLPVFLIDASNQNPIAFTHTDALGYFRFTGLNGGNYTFWVDHPQTDNSQSPMVALNAGHSKDSLQFELTPLLLILEEEAINRMNEVAEAILNLYPNPGTDRLYINGFIHTPVQIQLLNTAGKEIEIQTQKMQDGSIEIQGISALPLGVYGIRVIDVKGKIYRQTWIHIQ